MKNPIRIISAIIIVSLLCSLTSCRQSNPYNPSDLGINPFTNGGNERNMIIIISDMHLGAVAEHIVNMNETDEFHFGNYC